MGFGSEHSKRQANQRKPLVGFEAHMKVHSVRVSC